jgi:membrane fusion protein (multidrug efflux system)
MKKILYIIIPLALIVLIVVRLKSNKETAQNRIYTYNKEQAIEVNAERLNIKLMQKQILISQVFLNPIRKPK